MEVTCGSTLTTKWKLGFRVDLLVVTGESRNGKEHAGLGIGSGFRI